MMMKREREQARQHMQARRANATETATEQECETARKRTRQEDNHYRSQENSAAKEMQAHRPSITMQKQAQNTMSTNGLLRCFHLSSQTGSR